MNWNYLRFASNNWLVYTRDRNGHYHSTHDSYRAAVDQADMIRGVVRLGENGIFDHDAWRYAVEHEGCDLSWEEWTAQDDDERNQWHTIAERKSI